VSFWEAQACCRWAGGRLPSEQEWEAAARGPEGSKYPWGNDWEAGICNSAETGLGVTSPVGLFPRSRQARLGIEDLAGNVWEWCDSYYDRQSVGAPRALRGGAFDSGAVYLRASGRNWFVPRYRLRVFGFRCVLALPRQH
jgi:formylglycine-generating enzyme required for sulfatase activity